jgi:Na+/proline symporter
MTSIAPWGMPQMVHKYYAIKDESQIVKGAVVCFVFALLVGCAAYLTGAFSHLLPPEILEKTLTNGAVDPQKLVPIMLVECLPQWLLAVILLLVLSASMSTLCSLALVSSAAIGVDLVKGYVAPNASEKTHLTIFRLCCAVFIFCAYFIALFNPSWIVALTSLSWGAVAGAFLAPYMYGLYWRRTTKAGAIAGMIAGLVVANGLYWGLFVVEGASVAKKYSRLVATVAMLVPFVVVPLVSLLSKPLSPERVAKAFGDEAASTEEKTDAVA